MGGWSNFFTAQVGASASLAGLVFVALSISFGQIIASPHLPNRALEALLHLCLILGLSSLYLVPGQTPAVQGIETLVIAAAAWLRVSVLHRQTHQRVEPENRHHARINTALGQVATLSWMAGGVVLLVRGQAGFYWLLPSYAMSYGLALLQAWVLLVEVNR